jgi:Arc/MetJ-type ribon-helix-helix transcriptional regulator
MKEVRMTITLRPEWEQLVTQAMRTGAYQDPHEVIGWALEMLQSENKWLQDHKEAIAAKIDRAFEQFERGDFLSSDQSRADMENRKEAWLRNRKP